MLQSILMRYVVGALVVAVLSGGGFLYVKHLKTSRDAWMKVALEQKRVIEIMKKDQQTDQETEVKKHEVDETSTADQLDRYYDELRRKAGGSKDGKPAPAKD